MNTPRRPPTTRELVVGHALAGRDGSEIAQALANAAEGAYLDTDIQLVRAEVHLFAEAYRRPEILSRVHLDVRRQWAEQLERHGLRPRGWPQPVVRFYAYVIDGPREPDREHGGMVELTREHLDARGGVFDLACVVLEGEGTPALD